MLYSKNNSYPKNIPFRIILSNGMSRTDPNTFTEEEIVDAGYIAVDNPPEVNNTQVYYWDETNGWQVRDKTEEELKTESDVKWSFIRDERDRRLDDIDWRYLRYASQLRLGISPIDDILKLDEYAQSLRDITLQTDPDNIVWPSL